MLLKYLAAVHVEPPVADEVLLVEEGAIGTQEGVLGETTGAISGTNMERLALCLWVSVVPAIYLAVTEERGLRDHGENGVVLTRHTRNGLL